MYKINKILRLWVLFLVRVINNIESLKVSVLENGVGKVGFRIFEEDVVI